MQKDHDLRGLSLISDLCILQGAVLAGSSFFLLALGSIFAFIPIVAGVLLIALGHYLDNLNQVAWWVVIIINLLTIVGVIIGSFFLGVFFTGPINITDLSMGVFNMALSFLIVGYLLRGGVRSLFFREVTSNQTPQI